MLVVDDEVLMMIFYSATKKQPDMSCDIRARLGGLWPNHQQKMIISNRVA